MTKREFLDRLERCLAALEAGERASTVEFYEEQIDDRMDDGMTEEQAVASLESPEDIAAAILAQRAEQQATSASTGAGVSAGTGAAGSGLGGNNVGAAGASGASTGERPVKSHRVLRGIGRAILGFFEVMLAIILLPVAIGLIAALAGVYLSMWAVVASLVAAALACVLACSLIVATLFVAPPATAAVGVATAALVIGLLGLTVLLALVAYWLGWILVKTVAWIARRISRGVSGKKEAGATMPGTSGPATAAKSYPSMPMPPQVVVQVEKPRRQIPLWVKFTITAAFLVFVAVAMWFGAVGVVGGPDNLIEQAMAGTEIPEVVVDGDKVDRIDVSQVTANARAQHADVVIGRSPDDNVHVVGATTADGWGIVFIAGSVTTAVPNVDGSTITLDVQAGPDFEITNPYVGMGKQSYDRNRVHVLVPDGWQGDIVCDDPEIYVTTTQWSSIYEDGFEIDGDVNLAAGFIDLRGVRADDITLSTKATGHSYGAIYLRNVHASGSMKLSANGTVSLADVDASTPIEVTDAARLFTDEGFDLSELELGEGVRSSNRPFEIDDDATETSASTHESSDMAA